MRIETDKIYCGDSLQVLQTLPDNCMDCCVTSPPYYALRDYGTDGQIGREATPEEYVSRITAVFHEVKLSLIHIFFNLLCDKADDEYNGKLPVHVRFLLDEFANIGHIPRFDKLIATIRSREMSARCV